MHSGASIPSKRVRCVYVRSSSGCRGADYDATVPDPLHFTDSDEANELIASDPMALLVDFALDQHWSVRN